MRRIITSQTLFLLMLCWLAADLRVWAQSPTGIIQAKVTDTTGTRVVGALITVSPGQRRNTRKKATTNDKGYFTIVQLTPGHYELVVMKEGYQPLRKVVVLDTAGRINARPINVMARTGATTSEVADMIADADGLTFILVPLTPAERAREKLAALGSFTIQPGLGLSATQSPGGLPAQGPATNPRPTPTPAAAQQPTRVAPLLPAKGDRGLLQLQSLSGERSDLVTNNQVVNLALNGRDLLDFMKLLPGVVTSFNGEVSRTGGDPNRTDVFASFNVNGLRGNQNDLTIDGISAIDTGDNNVRHVTINTDAVAELKVLMGNYQAEYGTGAGGLTKLVMKTKSGGDQLHGGGRFFHRHEGLNANSFSQNLLGRPRPLYRYNSIGYEIGGPVYLPLFGTGDKAVKKIEKLFFYANQEFYRQLIPQVGQLIRVPTAAERNGDFSQNTLALRDPRTTGTCTALNQPACFPGNRIPRERWNASGLAILNLFPLPNTVPTAANPNNYFSQLSHDSPRREDIVRLDYEPTDKTDISARIINNSDLQKTNYGAFPIRVNFPLTPINVARPGQNFSLMVTHAFNETTINELIVGLSRNHITINGQGNRLTNAANGLNFPLLFPSANSGDLIPSVSFSGFSRGEVPPFPDFAGGPFESRNQTWNLTDNFTKVWRDHTFKGGLFWQNGRKNETALGASFPNARVDFGGGSNFTGNPFANVLLGEYSDYRQANRSVLARYRFNTLEGYFQDLWRVNDRLVLDFGLRVSWIQPQYDQDLQLTSFNPALYDKAKAPRVYQSALINGRNIAVDPADPTNTKAASYIGLLVPGTGDVNNGFGLASKGYPRGAYDGRGAQFGPRLGFAYDLLGDGRTIVRGGFGVFYDRVEGNRLRDLLTNPPTVLTARLLNGNLNNIESLGRQSLTDPRSEVSLAPAVAVGVAQDGKIPTVYSYSLNVQRDIGWETVVDVAYVGTLGRHLMQVRNLNAIPYGTTFTRAAQNPANFPGGVIPDSDLNINTAQIYKDAGLKFDGSKALPRDLLRPFPGFNDILFREFVGSSNYHSLQASARRRLSRDLTFGVAYTWAKAFDTANSDQEATSLGGARAYDYRLATYDRQHTLAVNYIYSLPKVSGLFGDNVIAKAILDNWKISGIAQFGTGRPLELGNSQANLQGNQSNGLGSGQSLTGSYTEGPRVYLRYDPYEQIPGNTSHLNPTALYLGQPGNIGPWPRQYWRSPNIQNHDLAIFKEVPLNNDGQYLQLRFEMFNAFNHAQFNSLNVANPAISVIGVDPITNDTLVIVRTREGDYYNYGKTTTTKFLPGCEAVANRTGTCFVKQPNRTGARGSWFGEPTTSRSGRVIQLGFKLNF